MAAVDSPVPSPSDIARIVRQGEWFSLLHASLQDSLLAAAVPRCLAGGERLFAKGDAYDGIYCVTHGRLRITATAPTGRESVLVTIEPPDWLGEISAFDGLPRSHGARADGDAEVLHVPHTALARLLREQPAMWPCLGALLAAKTRVALAVMEDAFVLPAQARVARRLWQMAQAAGPAAPHTLIKVQQEQLGRMLSLTRQTVNLVLKDLEACGAVERSYGSIKVVDLAALRTAAKLDTPD